MRKFFAGFLFAASVASPLAAMAAVDASLIPDGTYVAKVEKVNDAQHVTILMENGVETTVTAANSVDFGKVTPNSTIKLSLIKGKVPVFLVQH